MHNLNIQIQKEWNAPVVKRTLMILWSNKNMQKVFISRGYDKGAYVNFNVECRSGIALWERIEKQLNKLPSFKNSSIVTFQNNPAYHRKNLSY